ncbi:8-oxo-dGTP diphosphatase MutT [Marinomonas ostreistagni]|uniref:8-oxo-dGTP diphosphatase n=1 Tax=Marinomonas ostreistagni TaxID=359209 RepID=A0ABS0ZDY3_9GAMM|nr:8-oxo-dGTP diphosphatase MutT [Marinomonas ostreistagni]MBJ7551827.1 8-oxo-dGTP diphosphatase MutT [Marinomonas ostreistagni]
MVIRVAAGIIMRDDQVFIALRSQDKHQGGCWEFPGGKVEMGEEPDTALARELAEECGIAVQESAPFKLIRHDYSDKSVELHFFLVTGFSGEPHGKEGQEVAWVPRQELGRYTFPEANVPIVQAMLA